MYFFSFQVEICLHYLYDFGSDYESVVQENKFQFVIIWTFAKLIIFQYARG